jgi:Trypsin-like peptidase domain
LASGLTRKLLSLIVVVAGVVAAQLAQPRKDIQETKPTLKETLGWIQDSLKDGDGDVEKQTDKGTETHKLRLTDFSGCRVHFVRTETAAGKETFHEDESFNLGVIDPAKVRFGRGIASNPGWFIAVTQNLINKIATKNTYRVKSVPTTEGRSNMLADDFYGLYGDDFAEAFTVAVKMCGGKPSIFAKSKEGDSHPQVSLVANVDGAQSASSEGSVKGVPPGLIATPIKPTPAQTAPPRKDIPAIAKAAKGAIVSIVMSDKGGKPIAQGSGFLVSKDGLIVTNYHVISEGSSAIVKFPDGAFYAVDGMLASDKARDVAIIKAHGENSRR